MDFMGSEQQSYLGLSIQVNTDWIMENHCAGCFYNLVLVNYSASFTVFCSECLPKLNCLLGYTLVLQKQSTGTFLVNVFLDSECHLTCIYAITMTCSSFSLFFFFPIIIVFSSAFVNSNEEYVWR